MAFIIVENITIIVFAPKINIVVTFITNMKLAIEIANFEG